MSHASFASWCESLFASKSDSNPSAFELVLFNGRMIPSLDHDHVIARAYELVAAKMEHERPVLAKKDLETFAEANFAPAGRAFEFLESNLSWNGKRVITRMLTEVVRESDPVFEIGIAKAHVSQVAHVTAQLAKGRGLGLLSGRQALHEIMKIPEDRILSVAPSGEWALIIYEKPTQKEIRFQSVLNWETNGTTGPDGTIYMVDSYFRPVPDADYALREKSFTWSSDGRILLRWDPRLSRSIGSIPIEIVRMPIGHVPSKAAISFFSTTTTHNVPTRITDVRIVEENTAESIYIIEVARDDGTTVRHQLGGILPRLMLLETTSKGSGR